MIKLPDGVARYIDALGVAAEDRLLERQLVPFNVGDGKTKGCLMGVACNLKAREQPDAEAVDALHRGGDAYGRIIKPFNQNCKAEPVLFPAAIRDRILSNRARRTLTAPLPESAMARG